MTAMRSSSGVKRPTKRPRRATLIVELLLVLPIMLMFVFSMIEFSLIFASREHLATASRAGARVAAQGGTREEISATIHGILGRGRLGDARIEVVYFTEEFRVRDRDWDERMDSEMSSEQLEATKETSPFLADRERVAVFVRVPLTHVVPDALRWAGLSLRHHELTASTVMNVE
jgi:hypothetical protein